MFIFSLMFFVFVYGNILQTKNSENNLHFVEYLYMKNTSEIILFKRAFMKKQELDL